MEEKKKIKVGIGFATGRKSFQKILNTYVYSWQESNLTEQEHIKIDLLVAYDLKYSNTKSINYTKINQKLLKLIDDTYFIGDKFIKNEIKNLIKNGIIDDKQAKMLFEKGYAAKRNIILYTAIKNNIDYLLFIDDDEYPIAVTKNNDYIIWSGQQVLLSHLENIKKADITNGHHCGYISPIPHIEYNEKLSENDFRFFIEAISNDIINWDNIKSTMNNGGVKYANKNILIGKTIEEVKEEIGSKFITGSNLCINLTDLKRIKPFYNPIGARGEDTFLATCLSKNKVVRVPCYTFHDGFSTYNCLMDGVLPLKLKRIDAQDEKNITRFYKACIGWVRYKPLLIYITQNEKYEEKIKQMKENLTKTIPKISNYFGRNEFNNIFKELEYYDKNVKKHYNEYLESQKIWSKICKYLDEQK